MDGRAVFKWAVRILTDSTLDVLAQADCQVNDIRWFIPHQANVRIIHAASDVLGFHRDAVFKNLETLRQHLRRLDPDRPRRADPGRPDRARRPAADLGLRRRAELGHGPLAVVRETPSERCRCLSWVRQSRSRPPISGPGTMSARTR